MSREIRPVALDWEHPVDAETPTYCGGETRYIPLGSREDLRHALDYQVELCAAIDRGEIDFNDADLEPVFEQDYMPELREGTPYGWQMYETTTEGTPVSPVFATRDELAAWLSSPAAGREQVSPQAAKAFAAEGWAPTFVSAPGGGLISGVASSARDELS